MSKEGRERDLDRKFTKLETWGEFLERWRVIDTEQEAVGLLYAAITVPPYDVSWSEDGVIQVRERVDFFLRWATHENEKVKTTARQLVIKHWLQKTPLRKEFKEIHKSLLIFLTQLVEALYTSEMDAPRWKRPPLFQPPYPRFVSEYLLKMYEVWHHAYQQEQDYEAFQTLTTPFTLALCYWGLAYVLARDGRGFKTMTIVERFLEERRYDPGHVLMEISGHGEPIPDLSFPGAHDSVNKRAALALLKMRYWSGEGVREKFERLFPSPK